MTTLRRAESAPVLLGDLRIGDLLAEGGEGKVYQLPLQPHLVFKAYRRPVAASVLDRLVSWPSSSLPPDSLGRVWASSAWPVSTVLEEGSSVAGLLLPRAPKRFSLRHRDGATRLASLSYLTADPAHRAAAYGIQLPVPAAVERFGLVYALARWLEVLDKGAPRVGHGDLSTKNVLWSLQRGPEVFVIDCDNCERFDASGAPLGDPGRRRAMTPNWDDPAVPKGGNPTVESDRYSLALIFLRVVGAANYPIQARQRSGDPITVEFPIPYGMLSVGPLRPGAQLWELCARGLSLTHPEDRPPPSAWVSALEAVLDSIGGASTVREVWANQGVGCPSSPVLLPRRTSVDVDVHPVAATPRPAVRPTRTSQVPSRVRLPQTGLAAPTVRTVAGGFLRPGQAAGQPSTAVGTTRTRPGVPSPAQTPPPPLMPAAIAALRRSIAWWVQTHRRMIRTVVSPGGRRQRTRALAFCAALDGAVAIVVLFVAAMVVSPFLGI